MGNISSNNDILTLLNPRIVKQNNELFFVLLSCLGLQNFYSYNIFFKINEKLISSYNDNEIAAIIDAFKKDETELSNILYNGFDNYKFGEDYFISESLYEYLIRENENDKYIVRKIKEDDIKDDKLDLLLAIKNHDAESFVLYFDYELPANMKFIHRNIDGVNMISLAIKKTFKTPDETELIEYSSIIDIFGLEKNGVFVIGYSDNANVELKKNVDGVIKEVLEKLNCIEEENGRYTIDIYKYIDNNKANLIKIDNSENKPYIMADFIIDDSFRTNNAYYDIVSNTSIDRYYMLQKALNRTFSIDELNSLCSTFFSIISEYSTIDEFLAPNNIYRYVVDYFKNYMNDDGLNAINIILGSTLTTTITNTNVSNCSCNSSSSGCLSNNSSLNLSDGTNQNTDLSMMTCADKYKYAMNQYLLEMLSNINFYCDWMWMKQDNEEDDDIISLNGNSILVPNESLIDLLIKLLEEFLDLGYDLSGSKSSTKCGCHTKNCPDFSDNSIANKTHCSNCNTIENYIQVLKWVKEGKLEENRNKINIYGKQFAHLLPGLFFN